MSFDAWRQKYIQMMFSPRHTGGPACPVIPFGRHGNPITSVLFFDKNNIWMVRQSECFSATVIQVLLRMEWILFMVTNHSFISISVAFKTYGMSDTIWDHI